MPACRKQFPDPRKSHKLVHGMGWRCQPATGATDALSGGPDGVAQTLDSFTSSAVSGALSDVADNMSTITTVAGALVGVGLARYLSGVVTSATSATGALISAAKSEVALAVAQDKAAQSAVAASGLKFIEPSKLFSVHEVQMSVLLSKRKLRQRKQRLQQLKPLTTALATGTATEKSGPELLLSVHRRGWWLQKCRCPSYC